MTNPSVQQRRTPQQERAQALDLAGRLGAVVVQRVRAGQPAGEMARLAASLAFQGEPSLRPAEQS